MLKMTLTVRKNRIEQLKAVPNGTGKGSWAASPQEYDLYNLIGTPGAQDTSGNCRGAETDYCQSEEGYHQRDW